MIWIGIAIGAVVTFAGLTALFMWYFRDAGWPS
jgi:hypothetical protein